MKTQLRQQRLDALGAQRQTTTRKEKGTMKSHLFIAVLSVLTVLCLTLAAVPASADTVLFSNYPIDGSTDGYTINNGYEATDSFGPIWYCFSSCPAYTLDQFKFGVWIYPGDAVTSVTWSIDSTPFGSGTGNINYGRGAGCSECATVTTKFISLNEYGYQVAEVTVSGLNNGSLASLPPNTWAWLTLKDATTYGASKVTNDPVYWDVKNCTGWNCPTAYFGGPGQTPPSPPNSYEIIGH